MAESKDMLHPDAEQEEENEVVTAVAATEDDEPAKKKRKKSGRKAKKGAAATSTDPDKKPNIFVRMGRKIATFWREYSSEAKKVTWMSWKDVRKNTVLVVVVAVAISVVIGLLDFGLSHAISALGQLV